MPPVLIETVRVRDGTAPLWPLHEQRLKASAERLRIALPSIAVPSVDGDAVLRLNVRDGEATWERRETGATTPLSLVTSSVGHRPYRDKTDQRSWFDRALAEARERGAGEPLLLANGWVAEAARFALLWERGGHIGTTALRLGVLPSVGVARARQVLGEAAIVEEEIGVGALRNLAFCLVNAARGVVPVADLDGEVVALPSFAVRLDKGFWS